MTLQLFSPISKLKISLERQWKKEEGPLKICIQLQQTVAVLSF